MTDQADKKKTQVQADNNSVATGDISISGGVTGGFHIGNSYGLSKEEYTRLFDEILSKVEKKDFTGECPYKGLDFFEESDADLFFGREKLVEELVSRVKASRTVFITGASGSGKSSLVRAGLIPALKKGGIKTSKSNEWVYASMKPGREPFKSLATSLSRIKMEVGDYFSKNINDPEILHKCAEALLSDSANQRFVLFIDQFEEVFTQIGTEEERNGFLNLLTNAAVTDGGRVIILFTMRSDFVPNCARYLNLNDLLNRQFIQIGAMQPEELIRAISLPALHVGLDIKPDLVAQIINEMNGEPGAPPLMQFALKDLFDALQEKGNFKSLSLDAYLERGGIHKALERHADETFSNLSESEQNLTRSIFSGLIEVGRDAQVTKRTANFEELVGADTDSIAVDAILQKLAGARLVTLDSVGDSVTVTLSHEKLLSAWTWLRKLVDENRDVIAVQNEIINDAREWDENKRDDSFLYRGARLANAREKLNAKKLTLSGLGMEFVQTGEKAYTDAFEQEKKRADHLQKITNTMIARQLVMQAQSLLENPTKVRHLAAILLATQSSKLYPSVSSSQILVENNSYARLSVHTSCEKSSLKFAGNVNFSADGRYIVSCGPEGPWNASIHIWEIATGKEIAHMEHSNIRDIYSVALSPDGKYVAFGSRNRDVRVWEVATEKEITCVYDGDYVLSVAFSPDGKYVVSGSGDTHVDEDKDEDPDFPVYPRDGGQVHVWEVSTGKTITKTTHGKGVVSVAFSSDGKYVVSGSNDKTVRIWEVLTGKEVNRLTHSEYITSVAISPDGKKVALGSRDGAVQVWDIQTGALTIANEHDFIMDGDWVTSTAFSPDGRYLASGSRDETALVWDVVIGKEIARMHHENSVYAITFSPDSKFVITGCDDDSIYHWEMEPYKKVSTLQNRISLSAIKTSLNGRFLLTNKEHDDATIWDLSTGKIIVKKYGVFATLSPDGKYLIKEGDSDNTVCVWDPILDQKISCMTHDRKVAFAGFSPNGRHVVSGTHRVMKNEDSTLYVWDTNSGKEIFHISLPTYLGTTIIFSPDGKYLVSNVGYDTYVWDVMTGKEVSRMIDKTGYYIAITPDSNYVVAVIGGGGGLRKDTVHIWETVSGKTIAMVSSFEGFDSRAPHIAFSPDSKYGVSGSDVAVCMWETMTGNIVARFFHDAYVISVAVSPDGKYIASGSWDKTTRIWQIDTGVEIFRQTHNSSVRCVEFSPNGDYVFSGCENGTVTTAIWQPQTLISQACSVVPRNLTRAEWTQYIGDILPYQAVCENLPIEEVPAP